MTITATCGHEIERTPDRPLPVKRIIEKDIHAISWQVLCEDCIAEYKKNGMLLKTIAEQDEWLRRGKKYNAERYR